MGAMSSLDPAAGRLLIAAPALVDPNFRATVVLLLEHSDAGTLGLVLNRPTEVPVRHLLPHWQDAVGEPAVVFRGGPVGLDGVIGLAPIGAVAAAAPVLPGVVPVDLGAGPAGASGARLFAGHAGWGSGQLEGELRRGSWIIAPAAPDDPFATRPEALWRSAVRRLGGLFTGATEDPTRN